MTYLEVLDCLKGSDVPMSTDAIILRLEGELSPERKKTVRSRVNRHLRQLEYNGRAVCRVKRVHGPLGWKTVFRRPGILILLIHAFSLAGQIRFRMLAGYGPCNDSLYIH